MPEFKFETEWHIFTPAENDNDLGDIRFRKLLSGKDWNTLPITCLLYTSPSPRD